MPTWPTIPSGEGYPLVDTGTGEFVSSLVRSHLNATYARVVTLEEYGGAGDGTTDNSTALQAIIDAGSSAAVTTVFLRPGLHYLISDTVTWAHTDGQLNITTLPGSEVATIEYDGSGNMIEASMPTGAAGQPSISIRHLELRGATGASFDSFIRCDDVRYPVFRHLKLTGESPTVAAFWIRNILWWAERVSVEHINDKGVGRVVYFDASSRTTGTVSFARAKVRDINLQGGASGVCKVDISTDASVYDSQLGPFYGNIEDGARVVKLTGTMGGTTVEVPKIEAAAGDTAYCFEVGTLSGTRPMRVGKFIARQTAEFSATPSGEVWDRTELPGLTAKNAESNYGIDIEGRRTAHKSSPANPVMYVTASGGASWPFTEFGNIVIQAGNGRDVVLMDSSGNILRGGPTSGTTANLTSAAHQINTRGKVAGKQAWNTTLGRPVWATGSAATDPWNYADGTTAHTPS